MPNTRLTGVPGDNMESNNIVVRTQHSWDFSELKFFIFKKHKLRKEHIIPHLDIID